MSDKKRTIGFGIVGTGSISDFHARAIDLVPDAKLISVFSRRSPEGFAEKFGVEADRELETMLKRPEIEAICVTTPSGAHEEIVIPALEAGKHVLCEKPLEVSLDRIDRMVALAKEKGLIFAAVFQSRFGPAVQTIKKAVEEGRFGRITLVGCHIKWWRSQEYYDEGGWRGTWKLDGGGALMNQGIHTVDLLQYLLGMPEELHARTGTLAHERIEVEDAAVANFIMPGGALGILEAGTSAWPGFARRIEISGDRGSAILEDGTLKFWQFQDETEEDEKIREAQKATSGIGGGSSDPKAISVEGHRLQIQDLVDAIREQREVVVPAREARNAVKFILSIYESARTGKSVRL